MSDSKQTFMLNESIKIRVEMLSDWHIGTGAGIPGNIDALIARDVDGFPCIPAKSLVGIWRDAMERLTYGLDNGDAKGRWSKWVELIFGAQPNQIDKDELAKRLSKNESTYSHSILSLQPARISEGLRNRIQSFSEDDQIKYKQALTFIKPEIKIDEKSGTAEDEALRFAEMGRIGTILDAECELEFNGFPDLGKKTISALLLASAQLVERIGGKRRRGAGKCGFEIVGKEVSGEVTRHLSESNNASITSTIVAPKATAAFGPPETDNCWQKMDYTLNLRTPVAIVTATLGNVSETLDFIPGTYLLPYLTKGKSLFKHIANGDMQVSPATIDVNGKRGLPVPKVVSAHKVSGAFDKERTVFNKFKDLTSDTTRQLKPFREGYVSSLDEDKQLPIYKKTTKTLLMHNTVDDPVQRPTAEVGGVYSRQAIVAETRLHGEIRFKSSLAQALSDLVGKKEQMVRLGTSKKDDYGLAELSVEKVQDVKSVATAKEELIVYLESDVLLRNKSLRQTNQVSDLAEAICNELNPANSNSERVGLKEIEPLIHTRRIESWHEEWGFPRPTLIAMQAGSCVKFEVTGKIDDTKLQSLEASGIGERRGEGYGRIRFNPKMLTANINEWKPSEKETISDQSGGGTAEDIEPEMKNFAKQIELTAWREELQRAVQLIADSENKRREIFGFEHHNGESIPPYSQIGGLRSAMMRLKDNSDHSKNLVTDWLKHLEETPNRIKKWDRNNNPDQAKKKTQEIERLINEESKIWLILCDSKINGKNVWKSPPTLVRTEKELQKELWAEAIRSLFDACMRAHKREGGGN